VIVEIAREPSIDTGPVFAGEAEHAVKARVAAGCSLDAALAFFGHVDALSPEGRAHRVAGAGATTSKDALLDRLAAEAVATRLDAKRPDGAVVIRVATRIGRASLAKRARHAHGDRSATGSGRATGATGSGRAAGTAITAQTTLSIIPTTDCACRRKQQYSKPPISHSGLLINKFTEIFR